MQLAVVYQIYIQSLLKYLVANKLLQAVSNEELQLIRTTASGD